MLQQLFIVLLWASPTVNAAGSTKDPTKHFLQALSLDMIDNEYKPQTKHFLRALSLDVNVPKLGLLQLNIGQQNKSQCQCSFDDTCSCEGALKFMQCVKNACESGGCDCVEKDGTDHFVQSCSQMRSECSSVGLQCIPGNAQCKDKNVAWKTTTGASDKKDEHIAAKVNGTATKSPTKYMTKTEFKIEKAKMISHEGRVFVEAIQMAILVICLAVGMASSSSKTLAKHTWSTIDAVVVTFVAYAWFHVVLSGLNYFALQGLTKVVVHLVLTLIFLSASMIGGYALQGKDDLTAVFNGIVPPMVVWCNAGFVGTAQKYAGDSVVYVFLILLALAVWYVVLMALVRHIIVPLVGKTWPYPSPYASGDATENKMAGSALAAGSVLWLHMVISGAYQTIELPHMHPPTRSESCAMLVISLVMLGVAMSCIAPIAKRKKESQGYWSGRCWDVLGNFVSVLPYFSAAFSIAHMLVENVGYPRGEVEAHLLVTLASTAVGVLTVSACAYFPYLKDGSDVAEQLSALLVGLGGFLMGVAWYSLLDNSIITMIGKGSGDGDNFISRFETVTFLSVIIVPIYVLYIKPITIAKTT